MSLKEQFDTSAENVKNLNTTPSDEDLLEIYALFKQATIGDCSLSKPGMFDFKGKAKWEAWNAKKGTSTDAAMEAYIRKVKLLTELIGLKA